MRWENARWVLQWDLPVKQPNDVRDEIAPVRASVTVPSLSLAFWPPATTFSEKCNWNRRREVYAARRERGAWLLTRLFHNLALPTLSEWRVLLPPCAVSCCVLCVLCLVCCRRCCALNLEPSESIYPLPYLYRTHGNGPGSLLYRCKQSQYGTYGPLYMRSWRLFWCDSEIGDRIDSHRECVRPSTNRLIQTPLPFQRRPTRGTHTFPLSPPTDR